MFSLLRLTKQYCGNPIDQRIWWKLLPDVHQSISYFMKKVHAGFSLCMLNVCVLGGGGGDSLYMGVRRGMHGKSITTPTLGGTNIWFGQVFFLKYVPRNCLLPKNRHMFRDLWVDHGTYQSFFFLGGTGGSPIRQKFCQSPHPTLVPIFWTKACPPPAEVVPENLKNLNTFLCQIWLLLSSKVP